MMDFIWCFLQIEIKMKKSEAVRWEKLEGEEEPKPKQFVAGLFSGLDELYIQIVLYSWN